MPEPYATPSQVKTFYAGEDTSSTVYGPYMRSAARLVQKYAPVPDPEPDDYAELAADSELIVGAYLFNSQGGAISSLGAEGMTLSLTNLQTILGLISSSMGDYYTGGVVSVGKVGWW